MVGSKEKKMVYDVAITSVGQMTVPKAVREDLGVVDRARIRKVKGGYLIERQPSLQEILKKIRDSYTPEQRERIMANAGMTASEMRARAEWDDNFYEEYKGEEDA